MDEAQIKHMVDRFLSWKLPENFNPDGGISFNKWANTATPGIVVQREPSGTNLFDATEADAMVHYLLDGLPQEAPDERLVRLKLRDDEMAALKRACEEHELSVQALVNVSLRFYLSHFERRMPSIAPPPEERAE